jgi:hypothetical protein
MSMHSLHVIPYVPDSSAKRTLRWVRIYGLPMLALLVVVGVAGYIYVRPASEPSPPAAAPAAPSIESAKVDAAPEDSSPERREAEKERTAAAAEPAATPAPVAAEETVSTIPGDGPPLIEKPPLPRSRPTNLR